VKISTLDNEYRLDNEYSEYNEDNESNKANMGYSSLITECEELAYITQN